MDITHQAERAGRWIGRAWRNLLRQDARATAWLVNRGLPRIAAASFGWIVKLTVLVTLLYVAFWLAIVLVIGLLVAGSVRHTDETEQPQWLERNPDDHREDLFYHPLSYNDDPDPRFRDPRFHDK